MIASLATARILSKTKKLETIVISQVGLGVHSAVSAILGRKRNTLPVIFHNLKNHDSHLIIKHNIDKFKDWQLSVIPQTSEKFLNIHAKVPVAKNKTKNCQDNFLQSFVS